MPNLILPDDPNFRKPISMGNPYSDPESMPPKLAQQNRLEQLEKSGLKHKLANTVLVSSPEQWVKTAQVNTSGINNITTPPLWFSPLHTVQSWQTPSKRREAMMWCRHFIENEPKVAAAINFYCFTPDNFVLMADGTEKRIDEIKIGDKVISGNGTIQKVKNVFKRYTEEDILEIDICGLNHKIKCTKNHEIPRVSEQEWRKDQRTCFSQRIKKYRKAKFGDFQVSSKWGSADTLINGDYLFTPKTKTGTGVNRTLEDCYLLGSFVAEGSYYWYNYKNTSHVKGIRISINNNELDSYGERIQNALKEYSADHKISIDRDNTNGIDIRTTNVQLSKMLYEFCGSGAKNKKIINTFIENASEDQLKSFLAGIIDGDGHFNNKIGCNISTSSPDLCSQLALICEKLHLDFAIYNQTYKTKYKGTQKDHQGFILRICLSSCFKLEKYSLKIKTIKKGWTYRKDFANLEDRIYRKIKNINTIHYKGLVYDLEIENVHSYCVNRCTVHNSEFGMNGFKLVCPSQKILNFYNHKVNKRLNLPQFFQDASYEYYSIGDIFIHSDIECPVCRGTGVDQETGTRCNHPGGLIKRLLILNPDWIEVKQSVLADEPSIMMMPDEELKRIVFYKQPRVIYDRIPDYLKSLVIQNKPIPLSNRTVSHIRHQGSPYGTYGTSLVRRLFTTLAYKTKLMTANWIVAERMILPVRVVKIGTDERPASTNDIVDMQQQLAATNNDPNLTIVTHHAFDYDFIGACHDDQTEVLTDNGFMKFSDLDIKTNKVLTYNIHSKVSEYQFATEKQEYDYNGEMYCFRNKRVDIKVTPNHKMLFTTYANVTSIREARDFKPNVKLIQSAIYNNNEIPADININGKNVPLKEFCSFLGYFLAEGSLNKNKVIIYQNKDSKCINHLMTSINSIGYNIKDYSLKSKPNEGRFYINNKDLQIFLQENFGKNAWNKFIPSFIKNLTPEYLELIIEGMINGDGHRRDRKNSFGYTTTSLQLINDIQEMLFKCGYATRRYNSKRGTYGSRPIYRLFASKGKLANGTYPVIKKNHITKEHYEGKVYCVTVPNGFFVTRRNGHITIQGNSGKILQVTQEMEYISKEMLDGFMLNQALLNGEMSCHDEETLTLTNNGFKRYNEITEKDKIGVYNPITKTLEYHSYIEKHVHDYSGDMIHFKTDKIDILVTPNHRMYTKKQDGINYEFINASDVKNRSKFIGSVCDFKSDINQDTIKIKNTEYSLSDFCKLVGFFVSEGSTAKEYRKNRSLFNKQSILHIHQMSYEKARTDIENLFSNMFHTHYSSEKTVSVYNAEVAAYLAHNCGSHSSRKRIPPFFKNLDKKYLELILDSLIKGDGYVNNLPGRKVQGISYTTVSKQLALDFVEIAFKCGYSTKITCNKPTGKISGLNKKNIPIISKLDKYCINISKGFKGKYPVLESKLYKNVISKQHYEGKVYCFTVPHGLFVTMRNGIVTVQGNSYSSAQVGVEVLIRRIESWRHKLAKWCEENVFKPIAQMQGFIDEEKSEEIGETVWLYPEIKWNDLQLKDKGQWFQTLVGLQQSQLISHQTLLEELNLNYDQEVKRLRYEQAKGSPAGAMIGGGTPGGGGGMGGLDMLGGGGGASPPGAPPAGGASPIPGGPESGGIGGDLGGVGPAPAGGAPTASLQKITKKGKQKKQEEHEPIKYPDVKLTSIEQKLAEMLTDVCGNLKIGANNIRFQFPIINPRGGKPFTLDFAVPKIKLGIEADGKIWHDSPEQEKRDKERDILISKKGWHILRFDDKTINEAPQAVKQTIFSYISSLVKKGQTKTASISEDTEEGIINYYSSINDEIKVLDRDRYFNRLTNYKT